MNNKNKSTQKTESSGDFAAQGAAGRVVIENVIPRIECGVFPVKRVIGETVKVEADIFADGHDDLQAVLLYRRQGEKDWKEVPMTGPENDRWRGEFPVDSLGIYFYSLEAWIDRFSSWRNGFFKKHSAGVDTEVDQQIGTEILREAVSRISSGENKEKLETLLGRLDSPSAGAEEKAELLLSRDCAGLMEKYGPRIFPVRWDKELMVTVEPEIAGFSSWYEVFPRSAGKGKKHGTFRDCGKVLSYAAELGFTIVYLPPIHPIGKSFRKGKNNSIRAGAGEPGSPWAIGSEEGGHKAIHPELGTEEDFRKLVKKAEKLGLKIALDIAFQCSPDHPYVQEHPDWFLSRPDGTIQYAENPPKKYEDIYPINFETGDWRNLWEELKSVFIYWIKRGVTVFRVDNPHTKSFYFWDWVLPEIKKEYPETVFLAEAFTKPKLMYRLAKAGFTQSYTYFTWRNEPQSLKEYILELYHTEVKEFFRPNFWPNTPDILHEYLQRGGKPAFLVRLILAATLSSNYGVYGPAFELLEHTPREEGSEEYLNSEKYEIKEWPLETEKGIREELKLINRIRNTNPALQSNDNTLFHACDNEQILCYSRSNRLKTNCLLVTVNFDVTHTREGWVEFSPAALGLEDKKPFTVKDLLTDASYTWEGYWNFIRLDPFHNPAHIFLLEQGDS